MGLADRLEWMLLGIAVGFVAGIIVSRLRVIEEKVDTVNQHVKRERSEVGFMRYPVVADVLYLAALIIVLWGVFLADRADHKVEETQHQLQQVTDCNRTYLGAFLQAVEPRQSAVTKGNEANVKLQKSWYDFVKFSLHIPPPGKADQRDAAEKYVKSLKAYLRAGNKSTEQAHQNPYPTDEELAACIDKETPK